MYKKILVPVDGSATSIRGLEEAIGFAKTTGATLDLVHVVDEFVITSRQATAVCWFEATKTKRKQLI